MWGLLPALLLPNPLTPFKLDSPDILTYDKFDFLKEPAPVGNPISLVLWWPEAQLPFIFLPNKTLQCVPLALISGSRAFDVLLLTDYLWHSAPVLRTHLFIAAIISSPVQVWAASPAPPHVLLLKFTSRVFWEFFVILVNMYRKAPRSCSTLGTLHFRFEKSPKTLISAGCLTPMKL